MKNTMRKVLLKKLSLALGSFFVMMLFSFAALFAMRVSVKKIDEAQALHVRVVEAKCAHQDWSRDLASAIGLGTKFEGTFEYKNCVLGQWLYSEEATANSAVAALVEKIIPVHQSIHETAQALDFTGSEKDRETYLGTIQTDLTELVSLLDEIGAITEKDVMSTKNFTMTLMLISLVVLLALGVVAFMASIDAVKYIKRRITEPIRIIERDAKRLQAGELNFSIKVDTDNEVGLLAESLTDSIAELSKYVNETGRVLEAYAEGDFTVESEIEFRGEFVRMREFLSRMQEALKRTFSNIDQNTDVVLSASEQVSGGAQNLAEGVEQQANVVTEISNKANELLVSVNEDAESSITASRLVGVFREKMAENTEQTHILDDAMEEIRERSHEISKVVKTIEDIASQTNMLSLNASIEAARAGEAGKGFAVVADQIRDLAAKSAQASQDTTGLIAESIRAVDNGSEIARKMAEAIEGMNADAVAVIESVQSISERTQFQAAALNELLEGIRSINENLFSSSATSEESAAASEELEGLANDLSALIKQFRFQ